MANPEPVPVEQCDSHGVKFEPVCPRCRFIVREQRGTRGYADWLRAHGHASLADISLAVGSVAEPSKTPTAIDELGALNEELAALRARFDLAARQWREFHEWIAAKVPEVAVQSFVGPRAWQIGVEALLVRAAGIGVSCEARECQSPATCVGVYEREDDPVRFSCDAHCGHGNEDGWCRPIARILSPRKPEAFVAKLRAALAETFEAAGTCAACGGIDDADHMQRPHVFEPTDAVKTFLLAMTQDES